MLPPESGSLVDPAARPSVPCCATGAHCIRCKCTYPASYFKAAVVSGEADPHPLSLTQPARMRWQVETRVRYILVGRHESPCTSPLQGLSSRNRLSWFPACVVPATLALPFFPALTALTARPPLPGQGRHLPLQELQRARQALHRVLWRRPPRKVCGVGSDMGAAGGHLEGRRGERVFLWHRTCAHKSLMLMAGSLPCCAGSIRAPGRTSPAATCSSSWAHRWWCTHSQA